MIAWYQKPLAPIATRTNHHIPHTTVLCDKPASKLRRFATVCKTTIVKLYCIFNVFACNLADITNCTHQSPHHSPDRAVRLSMETDPPASALSDAIGHGNEVSGMYNDGGKASGEDLNENWGESSGEETSLPNPNPKRIYNTAGFRKRKRCLSRHKKGQQKQTTYDFSSSRASIGIPNANAHQIDSSLVGDHQIRNSHRSPTKSYIKREKSSLKMRYDHLQKSHKCRGGQGEKSHGRKERFPG